MNKTLEPYPIPTEVRGYWRPEVEPIYNRVRSLVGQQLIEPVPANMLMYAKVGDQYEPVVVIEWLLPSWRILGWPPFDPDGRLEIELLDGRRFKIETFSVHKHEGGPLL